MSGAVDPETDLRIRAFQVRMTIERVALAACSSKGVSRPRGRISVRLSALLPDDPESADWWPTYEAIAHARLTYRRVCDVMHGRWSMVHLTEETMCALEHSANQLLERYARQAHPSGMDQLTSITS